MKPLPLNTSDFIHTVYDSLPSEQLEQAAEEADAGSPGWTFAIDETGEGENIQRQLQDWFSYQAHNYEMICKSFYIFRYMASLIGSSLVNWYSPCLKEVLCDAW